MLLDIYIILLLYSFWKYLKFRGTPASGWGIQYIDMDNQSYYLLGLNWVLYIKIVNICSVC